MKIHFQCCFCGNAIAAVPPDVAVLTYSACAAGDEMDPQSQQLFCHTKCLQERLHDSAKLYAAFLAKARDGF